MMMLSATCQRQLSFLYDQLRVCTEINNGKLESTSTITIINSNQQQIQLPVTNPSVESIYRFLFLPFPFQLVIYLTCQLTTDSIIFQHRRTRGCNFADQKPDTMYSVRETLHLAPASCHCASTEQPTRTVSAACCVTARRQLLCTDYGQRSLTQSQLCWVYFLVPAVRLGLPAGCTDPLRILVQ